MDDPGQDAARPLWRRIGAAAKARAGQLADLALPPVCLACRKPLAEHDALCSPCWRSIDFVRPPLCDRLGLPMPYDTGGVMISAAAVADPPGFDRARAVALYGGAMRDLVRDFKFHDRQDSRRLLGRWLAEAARELVAEAEVIVPVPLHRWRLLTRRFNQSAILAHELARRTGLPVRPLALVRSRATASQVGKSRSHRQLNVRDAFAVPAARRPDIDGKAVLLVDDVMTTGATAEAAARALAKAGARRVDVAVLAIATGGDLGIA